MLFPSLPRLHDKPALASIIQTEPRFVGDWCVQALEEGHGSDGLKGRSPVDHLVKRPGE